MSVVGVRDLGRTFHSVWVFQHVIFVWIVVQMVSGLTNGQCANNTCPHPEQTLSETPDILPSLVTDCYADDTEVFILCNRGFRSVDNYTKVCNGDTGEFEAEETCRIDILTLLIAIVIMLIVVFAFLLLTFLVWSRYTRQRKKAMYDTSLDVSEVIDGHREDDDHDVVNIAMGSLPPSQRIIAIEEEDNPGNLTDVEVHYANSPATASNEMPYASIPATANGGVVYANTAAMGHATEADGDDMHNGMVPSDPQAGNSREKLIEIEREEPEGEAETINPYGNIERPLKRARRGPSDLSSGGGSARVRPVTSPPVFQDRSASVRSYGGEIDALYAKINKVKRASERWPPGSGDAAARARPRGRPADLDDLLTHITPKKWSPPKSTSPTRSSVIAAENMYAQVDKSNRNRPGSTTKPNSLPTLPKPARTKPDRPKATINISSNFSPPSPPPMDGIEGLYAEIGRGPSATNQDPETGMEQPDSPSSGDEGFIEQPVTQL